MTLKPITAERLAALGACRTQLASFRELFPEGAPLTVETALSVAGQFDWGWAAQRLLSATAWKAYNEATATAWKAYNEATATAWKDYSEVDAPAWKAYNEATATARKAYNEAKATASKAYSEVDAPAFALAYLNDKG